MRAKIFLIAGVVFIVAAISVFFIGVAGDEKMTLTGQFVSTKNCMGVVEGTLITDYGDPSWPMCDNAEKYEGKVVEVTGWVYHYECQQGEECFGGPYMRNVESIEILG